MLPQLVRSLVTGGDTDVVDALVALEALTDADQKVTIDTLLRGPHIDDDGAARLADGLARVDFRTGVNGGVYFYLFARAADLSFATSSPEEQVARREEASRHLNHSAAKLFIVDNYRFPRVAIEQSTLTFYRAGTTSYILLVTSPAPITTVLKILKWPYLTDPFLTDSTSRYLDTYGGISARYAPALYKSDNGYIWMEYIHGTNLREFLETLPEDDSIRRSFFAILAAQLCAALKAIGKPHLDLSPDNIIVEAYADTQLQIRLLDFGYNYLLRERVGSSEAMLKAQRYIAPELLNRLNVDPDAATLADPYSLGMILLGVLVGSGETQDSLVNAWTNFPEFAPLLDELLERDPRLRMATFKSRHGLDRYDEIHKIVDQEVMVRKAIEQDSERGWYRLLEKLPKFLEADLLHLIHIVFRFIALSPADRRERRVGYFLAFATISQAVNYFIICWYVTMFYQDSGLHAASWSPASIFSTLVANWPALHANQPGRLVAVSFSILATHYYMNLFSGVSTGARLSPVPLMFSIVSALTILAAVLVYFIAPSVAPSIAPTLFAVVVLAGTAVIVLSATKPWVNTTVEDLQRRVEWSLRINAFIYAPPILLALLYDPHLWPYCSMTGVLVVALNNKMANDLAVQSKAILVKADHWPPSAAMETFLKDFGNWAMPMALYAVALGAVGVLLWLGWARDEFIYAVFTVSVNAITYKFNCTEEAPKVRADCKCLFSKLIRELTLKAVPSATIRDAAGETAAAASV